MLTFASPEVWDTSRLYWENYVGYYRRPDERGRYLDVGFYWPGYGYRAIQTVALYLRERTAPADSIYVWGFDPLIYHFSDRPTASRFLLSFPLMSDWAPDRWQREFIDEIKSRRPPYIVVQHGQPGSWIVGHNIDMAYVQLIPAFQHLLDSDYTLETELVGNLLYRRNDTTVTP